MHLTSVLTPLSLASRAGEESGKPCNYRAPSLVPTRFAVLLPTRFALAKSQVSRTRTITPLPLRPPRSKLQLWTSFAWPRIHLIPQGGPAQVDRDASREVRGVRCGAGPAAWLVAFTMFGMACYGSAHSTLPPLRCERSASTTPHPLPSREEIVTQLNPLRPHFIACGRSSRYRFFQVGIEIHGSTGKVDLLRIDVAKLHRNELERPPIDPRHPRTERAARLVSCFAEALKCCARGGAGTVLDSCMDWCGAGLGRRTSTAVAVHSVRRSRGAGGESR